MNRNVRQGKLLTKLQEMSFFKKNILFIAICFVLLVFSTIGYAALNQKLFISGDLALRAVKDIRISDLKLVETLSGGYEQYNSKYTADTITITSALAEDGSATTYQATITNYGTTDMEIASISSNSTTWFADCTISGLAKGDEISAGASKTFKITLKRKANIATTSYVAATLVEFKFQEAKVRYLAYNIGGNSIQNGTPSPSSASEIESVGEKTDNLLDMADFNVNFTDSYYTNTKTNYILKPSTTYTLSFDYKINSATTTVKFGVGYGTSGYSTDIVYSSNYSNQSSGRNTLTFTTPDTIGNDKYLAVRFARTSASASVDVDISSIQLEEGSISSSYEPYGYKIPIKISGKNLFNAPLWETSVTGNGITVEYLESEDCFLLNGTATSTNIVAGKYINIPSVPGTSYVLSAKYVSGSIDRTNGSGGKYAVAYFGNADTINTTNNWHSIHLQNQDVTGSVKVNNKNYITRFWFYVSQGVTFDNYKVKIQLEEGSTATDYVPYVEPKTYNIYLDEPLRKVGNYADSIDYASGKIIRNVGIKNLSEIKSLSGWDDKTTHWYGYFSLLDDAKAISELKIMCDKFECKYPRNSNIAETYLSNDTASYPKIIYYSIVKTECPEVSSQSEMLTWLKNTNANIHYVLATPIEKTIELPEITVSSLYTNYEILTDVGPSNFTYEVEVKN